MHSRHHTRHALATATAAAALSALQPFSPSALCSDAAEPRPHLPRPNILIILTDDMGFSDIGCYGGEIQTPALDKLASRGLRFTQFYNGARCCPTRAALLTGLYAHQAGMGGMTNNQRLPGYTGSIRDNCMTIAEMLRPAGYDTYAVGKWHVAHGAKEPSNWPLKRGFNHYYGIIDGAASYFDPATLCRDNTLITPLNDPGYKPDDGKKFYLTDAFGDNAIRFLQQHQRDNSEKPFFMYLAFTAAHWPLHALPEDIAKYKGKYDQGYDPVRQARYKRLVELGVISPDVAALSPPDNSGWDNVKNKSWETRCMEVYAAQIDRMDQNIARIIATLERTGQLDNTIILFLQDNGACAEPQGRFPLPPASANTKYQPLGPDDLQPRNMPPMQTRDGRVVRTGPGVMPGGEDTYISYGHGWANVSDTPFREFKRYTHEGGISTPLIAHWPAGIPAALGGTFVRTPAHIIDIAATCLDLANAAYPAKRGATALTPLAGISLRPLLGGAQTLQRPAPLFWEHIGNRAVRDGDWKLVAKGPNAPWELYNMATDRSELHNLAAQHRDIVDRLAAAWRDWAKAGNVLPWPYDEKKQNGKNPKAANRKKNAGLVID